MANLRLIVVGATGKIIKFLDAEVSVVLYVTEPKSRSIFVGVAFAVNSVLPSALLVLSNYEGTFILALSSTP